jgi:hypothetical protein
MLSELREENDRGAAIVGASFLEWYLALALKSAFRPVVEKDINELFDYPGVLSTLASKITLAYALNIIGPQTRNDFGLIKNIRN